MILNAVRFLYKTVWRITFLKRQYMLGNFILGIMFLKGLYSIFGSMPVAHRHRRSSVQPNV